MNSWLIINFDKASQNNIVNDFNRLATPTR